MRICLTIGDYLEQAMAAATYHSLADGSFAGRISPCPGVIAFGISLRECEDELRFTFREWILIGLELGHPLPVLDG